MQDFTKYAMKRDIQLYKKGPCQFCGALVDKGIFDCMDIYNRKILYSDYAMQLEERHRFLLADCHCLQHPEVHGRWNNHIHLIRLHLIIVNNIYWTPKMTVSLSKFFAGYKKKHPNEILDPPSVLDRGKTTVVDLASASTFEVYKQLLLQWSREVYRTWNRHHELKSKIASDFIDSYN